MRVKKSNWRIRQRDELARDMVARRLKVWFMRDGVLVEDVPTLTEARDVADDMQLLLDVANGDLTMEAAEAKRLARGRK